MAIGNKKSSILFLIFSLFIVSRAFSVGPYLNGEFSYNLNLDLKAPPFAGMSTEEFESKGGEDYEENVQRQLLEEARWVFSAMIYGLSIEYTPSDTKREVDRLYEAELLAEIPFGDPKLRIYDTYLDNNIFYVFARYELDPHQKRRVEYWESGVFESGSAYGYFPFFDENSRINAIKDGIRIALENQLKSEEYNKPGMIEAEVLLRESPFISVEAGNNRALVRIRSNIKNVRHYRVNN